jgi:NAD(P)-dependent dehydrogenase (short-subunit alcohol dehydrogenase family)
LGDYDTLHDGDMTTRTALVTGATGGIGLYIAREFAERGWTVLVGARDAARGTEAAGQFGGRHLVLDVTDAETIATAVGAVPELDALVNNAGISLDTGAPVTETDVEAFHNALTVFYAQALIDDGVKVNALAPGLRATNLNPQAAAAGGDPAEAAAGAIRLATLPDDGPTGQLFSWDGTVVPW